MTSRPLADMRCIACRAGTPPLRDRALADFRNRLGGDWVVINEHHLERIYRFGDFRGALDFTNAVGEIAEKEGHHPEITLTWGFVGIRIWTHKIDGLTESDFVLAAKIDRAFAERERAAP
ncbi:MAG: 4a-hydroxytetrahydrobiopterin dehydratase [Kiritimatiellae bacterium]|nr:4a-hydroxytetrahydrobiopterin dehydratase [Kiritimatiellia bacterium]